VTSADAQYVSDMLRRGYIASPCLEMGVALEGSSLADLLQCHGVLDRVGTDVAAGPVVDVVADFEQPADTLRPLFAGRAPFASVLCLNVLEHTFEPVRVLDNVFRLLRPGGTCVAVTPARWPLHAYPIDCCRLLPDFYVEYARRRGVELIGDSFQYVGHGPVEQYRRDGDRRLPPPHPSRTYRRYSHLVHRAFQTTGRHQWFAELVAIGVVMRKRVEP
jgi:SAM-dependent methyltransferase